MGKRVVFPPAHLRERKWPQSNVVKHVQVIDVEGGTIVDGEFCQWKADSDRPRDVRSSIWRGISKGNKNILKAAYEETGSSHADMPAWREEQAAIKQMLDTRAASSSAAPSAVVSADSTVINDKSTIADVCSAPPEADPKPFVAVANGRNASHRSSHSQNGVPSN